MKALVICDDFYHHGDVVEAGMKPLQSEEISLTFRWDTTDFSAEDLQGYAVICLCKANRVSAEKAGLWLTEEVQNGLIDFVRSGGGLLALHAGTTAGKNAHSFRRLVGCVFDHHPEACTVEYVVTKETPITAGTGNFSGRDEHYFLTMDTDNAEIFLESRSHAGSQPAGYLLRKGQGRICVMTPGHNLPIWLAPEYQTMLKNALLWCAGEDTYE